MIIVIYLLHSIFSGHLVPSPIVGLACAPIVDNRFLDLAMSLLDFSPRIPLGTFSILLCYSRWTSCPLLIYGLFFTSFHFWVTIFIIFALISSVDITSSPIEFVLQDIHCRSFTRCIKMSVILDRFSNWILERQFTTRPFIHFDLAVRYFPYYHLIPSIWYPLSSITLNLRHIFLIYIKQNFSTELKQTLRTKKLLSWI